jgi:acyl-coenzyme A thioesterase PaaI-like protein
VGYLRSGVTATLADQLGSAVFFCSGIPSSGVSIEISVSFVDSAAVGVRPSLLDHISCCLRLWYKKK